ncbi:hypothetical protein [Arhodomonas sp. AD133]|uniref:hypothetical protein n=1 Tax=Arhodomonas sp. AD133 TaxID=3415009 RepID=UPI003EBC3E6F
MSYQPFRHDKPDPTADNGVDAFTNTRENLLALRDAAVLGVMPGWSMSTSGQAAQPDTVTYARGSERIRIAITWSGNGFPQQVALEYSNDLGENWQAIGTETITYDTADNVVETTWS